jgi:hypothetical protein
MRQGFTSSGEEPSDDEDYSSLSDNSDSDDSPRAGKSKGSRKSSKSGGSKKTKRRNDLAEEDEKYRVQRMSFDELLEEAATMTRREFNAWGTKNGLKERYDAEIHIRKMMYLDAQVAKGASAEEIHIIRVLKADFRQVLMDSEKMATGLPALIGYGADGVRFNFRPAVAAWNNWAYSHHATPMEMAMMLLQGTWAKGQLETAVTGHRTRFDAGHLTMPTSPPHTNDILAWADLSLKFMFEAGKKWATPEPDQLQQARLKGLNPASSAPADYYHYFMALSAATQELVDAQACTVQGALNIFENKVQNSIKGTEFLRRFHEQLEQKQSESASISLEEKIDTRDHSVVSGIMLKVRDYFTKHGYNCDNMSKIQGTGRRVNQISTEHERMEEREEERERRGA